MKKEWVYWSCPSVKDDHQDGPLDRKLSVRRVSQLSSVVGKKLTGDREGAFVSWDIWPPH